MEKPELKEVVEAMKKLGYNPKDFNWDHERKGKYLQVSLKEQPKLRFVFHSNPNEFNLFQVEYTLYRPDYRATDRTGWTKTGDAVNLFSDWLREHIRQFFAVRDMPDPLAEVLNETFAFDLNEENKYEPISDDDKLLLKAAINTAKEETFKQFDLNPDVKEYVESQYKYLQEKVETSNRYDFGAVAMRLLYDIGVNVTANAIVMVGSAAVTSMEVSPLFVAIVTGAFKIGRFLLGNTNV